MNASPFSTRHVSSSATADRASSRERALVLGGGGSAGNAWLIGVIAGLFEAGSDVTDADLIIGTSAGSTAAAQITGAPPSDLLAAALTPPPPRTGPVEARGGRGFIGSAMDHLERTNRIIAAAEDVADMRRRIGAAALEMDGASDASVQARWRATVAGRLAGQSWPDRSVRMVAVDARTGEPVVFDRDSGVDLVDAVAASCAGGFAYGIGDGWFVDGGYRRSSENADLAAGYGRVLVLSPLGGRTRHPQEWGTHLAAQVEELRAGGSKVETILPDGNSLEAFGDNMMDMSRRPLAARAGCARGEALAGQLTEFWR
jgi:NTE family protein